MESSLQEAPGGLIWLATPPFVRSTRLRLLVAMGVASIFLAALLTLDVELKIAVVQSTTRQERPLTVRIRKDEANQIPDFRTGGRATTPQIEGEQPLKQLERAETAKPLPRGASDGATEPPVVSAPARDWNTLAERIAKETVDDYFRRENVRASMWRQTRSIMSVRLPLR